MINCQKRTTGEDEKIGKRIRLFRTLRNLAQADLAKVIGVTIQQVQKYESGHNRFTCAKLLKLCDFYKVSPLQFLTDTDVNLKDIVIDRNQSELIRTISEITDKSLVKALMRIVESIK